MGNQKSGVIMGKGKWQAFEIIQRGCKYYIAGRLIDPSKPALIDNIEFDTALFYDRKQAQELADWMNKQDEQKGCENVKSEKQEAGSEVH